MALMIITKERTIGEMSYDKCATKHRNINSSPFEVS